MPNKADLPVWKPAPPRPGEKLYSNGLRIRPAPAGIVAIPLSDAMKNLDVQSFRENGLAAGEPESVLSLVTTGDYPPDSTGQFSADRIVDRIAWVLTFRDSPVAYYGPAPVPDALASAKCDFVIVIGGLRADYITGFQDCIRGS